MHASSGECTRALDAGGRRWEEKRSAAVHPFVSRPPRQGIAIVGLAVALALAACQSAPPTRSARAANIAGPRASGGRASSAPLVVLVNGVHVLLGGAIASVRAEPLEGQS